MFTEGFKKIAGVWSGVGKAIGATGSTAAKGVKAVLPSGELGRGMIAGARGKVSGKGLEEARMRSFQRKNLGASFSALADKAEKVKGSGAKAVQERFNKSKPSFAHRHPIATAGGAFLAGKYVFGDKSQPDQGPQIQYPQQY